MNRRSLLAYISAAACGCLAGVSQFSSRSGRSHSPNASRLGVDPISHLGRQNFRTDPIAVGCPDTSLASLVPSKLVADLLLLLTPCWYPIKSGKVLHALRLWGVEEDFSYRRFARSFATATLSGKQLFGFIFENDVHSQFAPGASPILSQTPFGVRVRAEADIVAASFAGDLAHVDDALVACAEIGLPLNTPIRLPTGENTLESVLRYSIALFKGDQEYYWSADAFARYFYNQVSWANRWGEVFTFDGVASELIRRPFDDGPCLGTHNLYTLAVLLAVHASHAILSADVVRAVERRLAQASDRVVATRGPSGCWSGRWAQTKVTSNFHNESRLALTSTGHHLEWMAIVPPGLRPPREVMKTAILGALKLAMDMTPYERDQAYLDLTHLVRALAIMMGNSPSAIVRDIE